ncbi:MAG: hypothetical protein LBV18_04465 [Alistipes sp.]|jgi:hypothetical protein|nr:hypothetical protein [Alistipes sp.]
MKKLVYLSFAACALAVVSCDALSNAVGGTKMDTEEATAKVAETLKESIDQTQWKVTHIHWFEGEELENDLLSMDVGLVNSKGGNYSQTFILGGPGAGSVGELREAVGRVAREATFENVVGIPFEMIDPVKIQAQYDAAKALLPEGYTFKSIGGYWIDETIGGRRDGEINARFNINITEDGNEVVESAGQSSIQYYEVDFNVLADGSVEIDE